MNTRRTSRGLVAQLAVATVVTLGAVSPSGVTATGAILTDSVAVSGNTLGTAASFGCGVVTLNADRDAWIDEASPGNSSGTNTTMYVRSSSTGDRRSLVHFAIPAAAAECTLTAATLKLYASAISGTRTLAAQPLAATWGETTTTWTNQPATTGTATTAALSATGYLSFDALTQVQTLLSDGNHGFLVQDQTEGSATARTQTLVTREGASPPQLVLTYS